MMNVLLILLAAPTCLLAQSGSITTTTTTTTAPRTLQPVIPCGGLLTEPNGTITSPGYPGIYPYSAECIWEISAPSPAQIVLHFNHLDLQVYYTCNFDFLKVRDGNTPTSTLLGKFCGSDLPSHPLVTRGPAMWIQFKSDFAAEYGVFSIFYQVSNGTGLPPTHVPCEGNQTSLTGEILSPGYPGEYTRLEDCVWTVEVPLNHQITLIFNHFTLEDYDCDSDYLEIWNGLSEESLLVGKFCREHPPPAPPANITLDTNQAYLRFVSEDESFNAFNVTYDARQTGCGRKENSTNGTFAAPGYPEDIKMESNFSCVWQFQTNPGNQLEISFSYINSTYMKVRTGNSQGQLVDLPDYTGRGGLYTVPIHNNSVWVEYAPGDHPNALPNTRSHTFKASFETVCGATINDMHGVIESPGFPEGYQKNMNCSWTLEAPAGLRYFLYLETVDLEPYDDNCEYDNVTVFDGIDPQTRQQVAVACQSGHQQNVSLSSRTGLIQLKSDWFEYDGFGGKGFRITYQAVPQSTTTTTTTTPTTTTSTTAPTTTTMPTTTTSATTTTTAPTTTMTTTTSTPTTTTTPAPTTITPTTTTTTAPTTTTTPAPTTTPTTTTATTTPAPTTTTMETTTNKAKTNVGGNTSSHRDSSAIAGGVIGGVIIIIIIVVVVALLRWRRRMNSDLPFTKFTNWDEGVTISGPKKGYKK